MKSSKVSPVTELGRWAGHMYLPPLLFRHSLKVEASQVLRVKHHSLPQVSVNCGFSHTITI
jgi:hypothetical protein